MADAATLQAQLDLSIQRLTDFVQGELADLLGQAARSTIDLSHPQFSVIASGVAKAAAIVSSSYREAAVTVLLPHIQVDSVDDALLAGGGGSTRASSAPGVAATAAGVDGVDGDAPSGLHHSASLPKHSAPLPTLQQQQLEASFNEACSINALTRPSSSQPGPGPARAASSVTRLLAQCNREGLEALMTLPADADEEAAAEALAAAQAAGGTIAPAAASRAGETQSPANSAAAGSRSAASSAEPLHKLSAARAAAAPGGVPGFQLENFMQAGSGAQLLASHSFLSAAPEPGSNSSVVAGSLSAQQLQQHAQQQQQHSGSLTTSSGLYVHQPASQQFTTDGTLGLQQQRRVSLTSGGGGVAGSSAQRLMQLQQMVDGNAAQQLQYNNDAMSQQVAAYETGQGMVYVGNSQRAGGGGGGGTNSSMLPRAGGHSNNGGGSSSQQLFVTQPGPSGATTYLTVDAAGNVTALSAQQHAALLQQQQQQQQLDWQRSAQHQQQQQMSGKLQGSLETLMLQQQQQRGGGGGGGTLQLDPATNTLYTTTTSSGAQQAVGGGGGGGGGGGHQLVSLPNGETIVVDSMGNQYTQDNFALYGQQGNTIELQSGQTLSLGHMMGSAAPLISINGASGTQLHASSAGLLHAADVSQSEPLPILVGVGPNGVMQALGGGGGGGGAGGVSGHTHTLHTSSLSSATLGGVRGGLPPGTILTSGPQGTTGFTGLIATSAGLRPGMTLSLAGAPISPLISRQQDMPGRFKILPAVVQQRILALCRTNPVITVRDFDDKVVSKLSLLVDSWGLDQALAMLDHLEHRMRTKQGAMKNGPGYLDVAVCSHLDMLKAQGACPKSMRLEDYAAQVLAPAVYHELCEAVGSNRWLAWEHFDQGIIQLVKKLPVESAVEKLQEITYHSFKNVDNIKGCIMSILNSKIREDRRRQ